MGERGVRWGEMGEVRVRWIMIVCWLLLLMTVQISISTLTGFFCAGSPSGSVGMAGCARALSGSQTGQGRLQRAGDGGGWRVGAGTEH